MTEVLEVNGVSSGYGDVQVLREVSLRVNEGEIVSVVGANGAGKTTLIRTIMGILPCKSGTITFQGQRIDGRPAHAVSRLGIAQVMEGRRLFPHMTVEENLLVGGSMLKSREELKRNQAWVYELFPWMVQRRRQLARSLSGGEQQMVAIGRALMQSPKLILLDEPSIGLAPVVVKELFSRFREINRKGVTILLVEQDVQRSLRLASRAYVIEQGRVVLEGPSKDLLENADLKSAYLGTEGTH